MHPNKTAPRVQSKLGAHCLPCHGLVSIFTKTMARKYFTEYTKLTHALTSCRNDQHEVCTLNDELWHRKTALGLGGEKDRQTDRQTDRKTKRSRFIQTSLCKIQGLIKYFSTVYKDWKLIKIMFYFGNARLVALLKILALALENVVTLFGAAYAAPNKGTTIFYWFRSPLDSVESSCKW